MLITEGVKLINNNNNYYYYDYLQEVGGGCGDWMSWLRIGTGGGHL
jgi:hypothetical protein